MELRPIRPVKPVSPVSGRGRTGVSSRFVGSSRPAFGAGNNIQAAAALRRVPERKNAPHNKLNKQEKQKDQEHQINMSVGKRDLEFKFADDADMHQLRVIDRSDGSVIRKIPSDEALRIIAFLKEKMQAALETNEQSGEQRESLDTSA